NRMPLDSPDWASIQYQNANNSVRITDAFVEAVETGAEWNLTARTDGSVVETVDAKKLMRDIAEAAWQSADPGVQYDTTINKWHTLPNTSRINASNPCSEYMSIDDSACNLASLNLMKFRRDHGADDRPRLPQVGRDRGADGSVRRPPTERGADARRHVDAPRGRRQHRAHRVGAGRPARRLPQGLGRRPRPRRGTRLPQRA